LSWSDQQLKFVRELSKIMPEAGGVAPLVGGFGFLRLGREHFGGEFSCVAGDFVEVAVAGFEIRAFLEGVALAVVFALTEGGEEGFPMILGFSLECVGSEDY
jgi:hypothetical protein